MKRVSTATILAAMSLMALSLFAADQKEKKPGNKVWDSGSFGIYMNGKRIGTEKFQIKQESEFSVASSEIKVEDGNTKADQTAEMEITPKGELRSYVWRATSPLKEESSVEPKDQLLVEHVVPADQKKMDVPHILPLSTVILDDNFFSQRELLVWRYLRTGCYFKPDQGLVCGPSHFGILVPHQHTAGEAVMDLVGRDKTTIKGQEQELNKFKLDTDGSTLWLWVTDDYKVLKMAASNFEVIRD
jgi:hypothetical protein